MNRNKELLPYYEKASSMYKHCEDGLFRKRSNSHVVGSITKSGYEVVSATIDGKSKVLKSHRLAWFIHNGELPVECVDHIDGNRLNNRISNLRSCSVQENNRNMFITGNNKTGYKGVYKGQGGKFRSCISLNNKNINLGTFDTAHEAHLAYVAKGKVLFGDFFNAG